MNNIEELREHCEEMMSISPLRYAYIPASSIITLIDRIEKAEAALSAASEKLSKPVVLPRVAAIHAELTDVARHRTSVENIQDVVEAIKAAGFTVEGE
ncbi:hypothetical protein ACRU6B_001471 [Yersinia enterocolitica]